MYKIMIADDEGIVIDAMKFIIEKNFGDICRVESAKTGRGVIELSYSFTPDIAFMDIQMPGINGIEAMKELRKNNQNIIFIIVSAYDKFDYAQEAINLGVWSYVTKPIDQSVIVKLLKAAMENVDNDRDKRTNDLKNREKLEIVTPIIESDLIYSILFQENFAEDIENYKQLLGIEEDFGYMLVIKCGDAIENGYLTNAAGISVRVRSSYKELREIVKEYFTGIVGALMANSVIVFVPSRNINFSSEYEERVYLIEKARIMVKKLNQKLDAQFRVGIGSVKKLNDANDSYMEAINSLRYTVGSVAHVRDLPISRGYEENYPIEIEKALFETIQSGDWSGANSEAIRFFNWMMNNHAEHMMDIKLKVLEFVLFAERIGYKSGCMIYHFHSREVYLQTVIDIDNFEKLRFWFLNKIQEVCSNIVTKKEESFNNLVARAKEYIKKNYNKDISLYCISKELNISPYYFSKLFKEQAGENFIDFLTNVRMEKAKELLKNTDKSMKEICCEVGYSDPNYFSRSFKKNLGVTPTEYKEGK